MNARAHSHFSDAFLAWFFVLVWGSGFIATKAGLQYAAPFTFLALRFAFGLVCLIPVLLIMKPAWPRTRIAWLHVIVAGLLVYGIHLSGSHYGQYLGISAGVVAIILASQPLLTALVAALFLGEKPTPRQWRGIAIGLAGVALVVWHKIDVAAIHAESLAAVLAALFAMTAGTLYQRRFCRDTDLLSAAFIQFAASLLLVAPLSLTVEGARVQWSWMLLASVAFLVIVASVLAMSALHTLMRHGEATRVAGMLYLPPVFAVALEWMFYGIVPTPITFVGIGVTCVGVSLVASRATNGKT